MSNIKFALKNCLRLEETTFIRQKRNVWDAGKPQAAETPTGLEAPPKAPVSLGTDIDNVHFKDAKEESLKNTSITDAMDKIVDKLDIKDSAVKALLKTELRNGLIGALDIAHRKNDNVPTNLNDFNTFLTQKLKVDKIRLQHDPARDNLVLRFYNEKGAEVFVTMDNVPIKFEVVAKELKEPISINQVNPNYNNAIKLDVNTKKTVLGDLAKNAKEGDILSIRRGYSAQVESRGKTAHAEFKNKKFMIIDGWQVGQELGTAAAPLIQGDIITLQENQKDVDARQIKDGKVEMEGVKYDVIAMRKIDQGKSYFELARQFIAEFPQISDTKISSAEYAELLKQAHEKTGKGAEIPVILPQAAKYEGRKGLLQTEEEQAQKRTLQREQVQTGTQLEAATSQLRADALKQGRAMFLENRTIHRDELKTLVDDAAKWRSAWENPNAMPGIAPLIYILKTEPIFKEMSSDPNFFRDRIREAIANGNKKQLDMEDIINVMLKGCRMPSFAAPAQTITEGPGVVKLNRWQDPEGNDSGRMRIANGFLKALGTEALNSAHVIEYESDDKVKIKFNYEGHCYVVKLNYDSGDNADSNVEVYYTDGKTEYPNTYGYNWKFDIENKDLLGSTAEVKNIFDNATRPRLGIELTYNPVIGRGLKGFYLQYYNEDGTPKGEVPPTLKTFFDNLIIGSTRMLDASTRLNLNEQALVTEQREERQKVDEWYKILHNNSVENKNDNFRQLVNNKEAFLKAWMENRIEGKSEILNIIGSEPAFANIRNLPQPELAERFRLAIENGSSSSIDAQDIYDILLQQPFNGRGFNEGALVSSDFKGKLNEYFNNNGQLLIQNPTPEQLKEIEFCRNFVRGVSRLLHVYATMNLAEKGVSSEKGFYSTYIQQQERYVSQVDPAVDKDPNKDNFAVYNLEDLIKYQNSPGQVVIGIRKAGDLTVDSAKGISVHRSVTDRFGLGDDPTGSKMGLALKNIFKIYGFEQLVAQNFIKKATNSRGVEFYVLVGFPEMNPGALTSVGTMLRDGKDVDDNMIDVINPQSKIRKLINKVFPHEAGPNVWSDVAVGGERNVETRQGLARRMSPEFANNEFLKMPGVLNPDRTLNEQAVTQLLRDYLVNGIAKIVNRFNVTKAVNSWTSLDVQAQLGNGQLQKLLEELEKKPTLTMEELDQYLNNPAALFALQEGFVKAHDAKVKEARDKVIQESNARFEKFKETHKEDIARFQQQLGDDLKKVNPNATPEQIERVKVEALPFFFYAGVTGEGFAVGAGVNFALDTGGGTILIGTSVFGATTGVGIEAHLGYQTPSLGPVSFAVLGGAGAKVGREFGVGYGVGAAIPINLNYIFGSGEGKDTTRYTLAGGVVYIPGAEAIGVPFGATVTFSKDHKARLDECQAVLFKNIGFDKVEAAQTDAAKVDAIKKDQNLYPLFCRALNKANPTDAELLQEYKAQKANLLDQLTEAYDPGWFDSLTIGVGYSPDGKIVFGLGGSFYVGRETVTSAYSQQDLTLQNELGLANQLDKQALSRTPRSTNVEIIEAGKRIKVNGKEGTRINMARVTPSVQPPEVVNSRESLMQDLNAKLAPLNLSVTWNEGMKMFKLNIENLNSNTNYEIAADHAMKTAGVVYKDGNVYLSSAFTDPVHPLTIQRADYNFPFPSQGANYLSLITISDNPYRSFNDVYMSSPKVIRYQNGVPNKELQDQFAGQINIPDSIQTDPNKIPANLRFQDILAQQGKKAPDSAEYLANRQKLLRPGGKLDQDMLNNKKYEAFASDFLKTHQKEYRKLSNAERNTEQFNELSKLLNDEFKKSNNRDMNEAELNYIRNVLVDLTATENPDRVTPEMSTAERERNAKLRRQKFEEHLNATKETIKAKFATLIESYNKKNPNSPIRRSAQEIADFVINDLRSGARGLDNYLKHEPNAVGVPIAGIESYEYVAGSMRIPGFRGELYTADLANHPEYCMLAASTNYIEALKTNPGSWQADYAKLIIEAHSAVPAISEQPTFEEAQKLVQSNLGSKIKSAMLGDETHSYPDILGDVKFRDALVAVAAADTSRALSAVEIEAVNKFKTIVNGIREAEIKGLTTFINPLNSKYTFKITKFEARDGVYNKCTNYAEWLNEDITVEAAGETLPQYSTALAAYNESTAEVISRNQQRRQTMAAALLGVVKVKNEPPPPPGSGPAPETPAPSNEGKTNIKMPNASDLRRPPQTKDPNMGRRTGGATPGNG